MAEHSEHVSLVDMQAQVSAAREEFMASVADLKSAFTPGALGRRALNAAGSWFTDEFGGIRPERVAIAGAVVAGFVVIKIIGARRR